MTLSKQFHREVFVVGVGLHRYQPRSESPYVDLGLTAVRASLADANLAWGDVEAVYTGTTRLGMGVSHPMLRHLGSTGIPMTQVENASASSSSAFAMACRDVAGGFADVVLAMGVDKPAPSTFAGMHTGMGRVDGGRFGAPTQFALLADEYMRTYDVSPDDLARVAVKNHKNGARNPYAHRQKERTLREVLADKPIAGALTRLQCCPIGEGASAALLASREAIEALGIRPDRSVSVLASQQRSDLEVEVMSAEAASTQRTVAAALSQAAITPQDLDVVELHDAFSVEELVYTEAIGLCGDGEAAKLMKKGEFDIGGSCAVSPSGGLLAMGHPVGPTGVGQIFELTHQLRGEAGQRQQPNARYGLAQMVGLGGVCIAHVLGGTAE